MIQQWGRERIWEAEVLKELITLLPSFDNELLLPPGPRSQCFQCFSSANHVSPVSSQISEALGAMGLLNL